MKKKIESNVLIDFNVDCSILIVKQILYKYKSK